LYATAKPADEGGGSVLYWPHPGRIGNHSRLIKRDKDDTGFSRLLKNALRGRKDGAQALFLAR
jgi:hypothetical protein